MCHCVRYWCQGSKQKAVQPIVSLIQRIGVEAAVKAQLYSAEVATDKYIVDRARAALAVLKMRTSEEQRQHYRIGLTIK